MNTVSKAGLPLYEYINEQALTITDQAGCKVPCRYYVLSHLDEPLTAVRNAQGRSCADYKNITQRSQRLSSNAPTKAIEAKEDPEHWLRSRNLKPGFPVS